ncbi:unnamed protein product [[Candida] boidinii]|nr:unnamed protein product [[Candida] boidinii]GMF63757.1 unnamed protein product [[Candida] boidinii]
MNPPDIDKTDIKRRKIDNTQLSKAEKSQQLPSEQSETAVQHQTEKPQQQQLPSQQQKQSRLPQQNNSQIPVSEHIPSNSKFLISRNIGKNGTNGIINGNGNIRHKSKRKEKQNKYTYYPVTGSYYLPPIQVYYFPHSSAHAEEKLTYSKSRNGSVGGDEKGSKYFTSPTTPSYVGLGPTYKYFLKNDK